MSTIVLTLSSEGIMICSNNQLSSTRQWSIEDTELLIGDISKYECIYETSSVDYLNSSLRVDARTSIAKLFNKPGKSCSIDSFL